MSGRSVLSDSERTKIRHMMKQMGIKAVTIDINPESSRDIAVYLSPVPKIIAGRKWLKAPYHERMKRVLHELCHCAGKHHDSTARRDGYYSNPKKDTYTARLYKTLSRNPLGLFKRKRDSASDIRGIERRGFTIVPRGGSYGIYDTEGNLVGMSGTIGGAIFWIDSRERTAGYV